MKHRVVSLFLVFAMLLPMPWWTAFAAGGDYVVRMEASRFAGVQYNGKDALKIDYMLSTGAAQINAGQSAVLAIDLNTFDVIGKNGENITAQVFRGGNHTAAENTGRFAYSVLDRGAAGQVTGGIAACRMGTIGLLSLNPDWSGPDNAGITLPSSTSLMSILLGLKEEAAWERLPQGAIRLAAAEEVAQMKGTGVVTVNNGDTEWVFGHRDGVSADTLTIAPTVQPMGFSFYVPPPPEPDIDPAKLVAADLVYGEPLSASALTNHGATAAAGTFAWKNGAVRPTVADSGKTEYEVLFTPADPTQYSPVTVRKSVVIRPHSYHYSGPETAAATIGEAVPAAETVQASGVQNEKVEGLLSWYTDAACTVAASGCFARTGSQELWWVFTPAPHEINYVSAAQKGKVTYAVSDLPAHGLAFPEDAVSKAYGSDTNYTLTALLSTPGTVAYSSDNPAVAEIDALTGEVTIRGVGTATITAAAARTGAHRLTTDTYILTVVLCAPHTGIAEEQGMLVADTAVQVAVRDRRGVVRTTVSRADLADALQENQAAAAHQNADETRLTIDATVRRGGDETRVTLPTACLLPMADSGAELVVRTNAAVVYLGRRALRELADTRADTVTLITASRENRAEETVLTLASNGAEALDGVTLAAAFELPRGKRARDLRVYAADAGALDARGNVIDASALTEITAEMAEKTVVFDADGYGVFLITTREHENPEIDRERLRTAAVTWVAETGLWAVDTAVMMQRVGAFRTDGAALLHILY